MKKKEWNEGLNYLDPDLVEKYVEQKDRLRQKNKKPKGVWLRFGAIAACFLLIVSAIIVVPMLREDDPGVIPNPGVDTDPDSNSGKRLPIVMTIAETLPSCVAFEYKDGNPYCFYAYDDDGKLYRVLWNNFDGLHEKDRIVVDHNDIIKTLSYDEYPDGGWTPQYEITAISIHSEEEWNAFEQNGG